MHNTVVVGTFVLEMLLNIVNRYQKCSSLLHWGQLSSPQLLGGELDGKPPESWKVPTVVASSEQL